jgi:hypothetical protein
MRKLVLGALIGLSIGVPPGLAAEVRTLPPAVYSQLKTGHKLAKVWISPRFEPAQGFRVGKVDSAVTSPFGAIVDYLPSALARLARPESANVLTLTVTELTIKEKPQISYCAATVGVEGQVAGPDGSLLMAFTTRQEFSASTGAAADCQGAVDTIVAAMAKELGMPLAKAVKARPKAAVAKAPLPVAPPAAAPGPATVEPPAPATAPAAMPAPAAASHPATPASTPAVPAVAPAQAGDPASRGHHF